MHERPHSSRRQNQFFFWGRGGRTKIFPNIFSTCPYIAVINFKFTHVGGGRPPRLLCLWMYSRVIMKALSVFPKDTAMRYRIGSRTKVSQPFDYQHSTNWTTPPWSSLTKTRKQSCFCVGVVCRTQSMQHLIKTKIMETLRYHKRFKTNKNLRYLNTDNAACLWDYICRLNQMHFFQI